jgi:hypothetical protein
MLSAGFMSEPAARSAELALAPDILLSLRTQLSRADMKTPAAVPDSSSDYAIIISSVEPPAGRIE